MAYRFVQLRAVAAGGAASISYRVGEAVSAGGGWILDVTLEGKRATSMQFAVAAEHTACFVEEIARAGLTWSQDSQTILDELRDSPPDCELLGTLDVSFVGEGRDIYEALQDH